MRIVIDCCLTKDWKPVLNAAGYECVHWSSIGQVTAPDFEIARWAALNDHVVLTQDLDYGAILATQGLDKPSVVQIRSESPLPEDVGDIVLQALKTYQAELISGAIATVHPGHARIRLLPLS